MAAFLVLAAPVAVAAFVSRTGRIGIGYALSALSVGGACGLSVAWAGLPLWAAAVLALPVMLEAAAAGEARRSALAAGVAAMAAAVVVGGGGTSPAAGFALFSPWMLPAAAILPVLAGCFAAAVPLGCALRIFDGPEGEAGAPDFAALAAAAPDAISVHRRNGNLAAIAPACERILGAGPGDLLGDGFFRRIVIADRPGYLKALDDALTGGEQTAEMRVRRGADPAEHVWIEMHCRALPVAAGERGTPDIVAVLRDIDDRKREAIMLEEARDEAERASFAKSRFLASVSHELRTPLNAIIGFSEILSQEMFGRFEQPRHKEYAELIRDSGRHLLDVINGILDMSKIESGNFVIHPEPFDLAAVIGQCAQMMQTQVSDAQLGLEADLPVSMPDVVADARAVRQMVLNLLHNAVKFSRPGGRIVVGAYVHAGTATIYVADEGIGIAADDIPRLGEPFVQAQASYDRRYEGTGLGLSVVKGLAALHGGAMRIDSTLGVGTRVMVELPLDGAGAAPGDAAGRDVPVMLSA